MDTEELYDFEELAEAECDEALLDCIRDEFSQPKNGVSVLNVARVKLMSDVFNKLKPLIQGRKISYTYKFEKFLGLGGTITIIGKNIQFKNAERFVGLVRQASNVDMFPKTDGTVQIDITFNNLKETIEETE